MPRLSFQSYSTMLYASRSREYPQFVLWLLIKFKLLSTEYFKKILQSRKFRKDRLGKGAIAGRNMSGVERTGKVRGLGLSTPRLALVVSSCDFDRLYRYCYSCCSYGRPLLTLHPTSLCTSRHAFQGTIFPLLLLQTCTDLLKQTLLHGAKPASRCLVSPSVASRC
jgi:hypothetical protein